MKRLPVLLVLFLCASGGALAQDRSADALDSLPKIRKIDQVAISPDGAQLAYIIDGELFARSRRLHAMCRGRLTARV
jgi:hypothetical protein